MVQKFYEWGVVGVARTVGRLTGDIRVKNVNSNEAPRFPGDQSSSIPRSSPPRLARLGRLRDHDPAPRDLLHLVTCDAGPRLSPTTFRGADLRAPNALATACRRSPQGHPILTYGLPGIALVQPGPSPTPLRPIADLSDRPLGSRREMADSITKAVPRTCKG